MAEAIPRGNGRTSEFPWQVVHLSQGRILGVNGPMMKSCGRLALVAGLLLLAPSISIRAAQGPAERRPPNVLLLLSDDQRPDTIHALGNRVIRTPNLDRLVEAGTTFTRAVSPNPLCVP